MKVKWEDFANRRNVRIKDMAKNMTYKEFCSWCEIRRVIPVAKSVFEKCLDTQKAIASVETVLETTDDSSEDDSPILELPTKAVLSRMNKSDLLEVCNEWSIEVSPSTTKKKIISLLSNLNN